MVQKSSIISPTETRRSSCAPMPGWEKEQRACQGAKFGQGSSAHAAVHQDEDKFANSASAAASRAWRNHFQRYVRCSKNVPETCLYVF